MFSEFKDINRSREQLADPSISRVQTLFKSGFYHGLTGGFLAPDFQCCYFCESLCLFISKI